MLRAVLIPSSRICRHGTTALTRSSASTANSFGREFGEGNALSQFTTFDQYLEHSVGRYRVHPQA
jgi:hypothetical protein